MKRVLLWVLIVVVLVAVAIQFVPVDRTNPPVTREVRWDSAQTRALAQRACFDCHSNETVWPWYARFAPVSFILSDHVHEGRDYLNFSQWDGPNAEFDDVDEVVREGEMPLWDYLLMHPAAKLSGAETEQLLAGLQATFAADPPREGGREREEN